MDFSLRAQRPVLYNYNYNININKNNHNQCSLLNSRSFIGFLPFKPSFTISHSHSWHINNPIRGVLRAFSASRDFSRKRLKKWSRGRGPKGFGTKPFGTASPKKDQKVAEDKRKSSSVGPELDIVEPEIGSSSGTDKNVLSVSQVNGSDEKWINDSDRTVDDLSQSDQGVAVATQHLLRKGDSSSSAGTVFDESRVDNEELNDDVINSAFENYEKTEAQEHFAQSEISGVERTVESAFLFSDQKATVDLGNIQDGLTSIKYQSSEDDLYETEAEVSGLRATIFDETTHEKEVNNQSVEPDSISEPEAVESELMTLDAVMIEEEVDDLLSSNLESDLSVAEIDVLESTESELMTPNVVTGEGKEVEDMKELDDSLQKLVLEKQAEEALRKMDLEREALRKQAIEQLAEDNFLRGNKVFIYPGTANPDDDIEVFFNKSLSSLRNEPDVAIQGAFNDWKWKPFAKKMEKTQLVGSDWWSCKIHVAKEAYKMDFVFNNGKTLYDNNDKNDFHINVEGGMDVLDFEDFLLLEKRRELDELAREQAERERQAEEQRRVDEKKAASEADLAQAAAEVDKRREMVKALIDKASKPLENVWFFKPSEFEGGESVHLYYNSGSGPLSQAPEIWVHGGYNGWQSGLSIAAKLEKSEELDAEWWYAQVTVPDEAIVLDWVFADGPPQRATRYDNNKSQDYHAIVPLSVPDEGYWSEEQLRIYRRLQNERRVREEAKRVKAEKTARMKAETKERTLKTFSLSQRHIVYTDPVDIQAGKDVTLYYNPSNTVLNGKPEVWFRCSFNRWTHHRGPLPPRKMLPSENGSHLKTTVKVPPEAYMMDFVFSEREDGGIFDNKNNMDYHIPVFGGIAKESPMHIVHIAVEMAPIAKVGGLADVVTSLSRAVQDLNHHVDILLPKYDCINTNNVKDLHYQKSFQWGGVEIKVWFGKVEGLSVYFLEPLNGLFWTGCVYAGRNDGHRFGFFCHAALEFLFQSGFHPDIIHCHDWSSAPVAWLYKDHYRQCGLSKARVVFTIHNLEFGANLIGKAMAFADKATTVSGTYSKEVAGNPAIAPHLYKFHGILNGIDPDIWDPYNDNLIPVSYTSENVAEGKQAAKEMLQQRLSIRKADVPVVGIISRLTHQKGIHLIKHAIWRTIERGGQVVLLGSAPDPRIQQEFVDLSNQMHNLHSDRGRLVLNYDEPLSHLIYAGADFILVPSIFEPCGLTQLVAMRYGAIPVVRKTGGLYDTVFDVDHDQERARAHGLEPNGFSFEGADQGGVDYALNRAISAWYDGKEWLNSLRKRAMEQDWSWNRPALEYIELYHAARKN